MADKPSREEFYQKLHSQLTEHHKFPTKYMFKFIVPNNVVAIGKVDALFTVDSEITYRESKTGKFVSVTGRHLVKSADEIIAIYQQAEAIEGLMSL
jgi:putative lipoic acid-binding regulatory protein